MRVKICGITNLKDALDAIDAGADALGFVFYEKSPRYIEPLEAKKIAEALPPFVQTAGLFVNESAIQINNICKIAKMNLAQIIDDENTCKLDTLEYKYILVARIKSKQDLIKVQNEFILVDAFVEGFGGHGKQINKSFFEGINTSKMIIAGGLSALNLKDLKEFDFYGFDVSSGVEKSKGKKDKNKMIDFIKAANET